jgi:uncharacterized Zn-finger protein
MITDLFQQQQQQQQTSQLIEELKMKEFTTASNMLFRYLNEYCQTLNAPLLCFPQPQLPMPMASPIVPVSPIEFPTITPIHSSTSSSPISSPSTSSIDSGLESEDDRRPHQCPECLKRFRFKSNLFEHKTLHQHATPFVCPFCSKTCRLKGNLKKHLQVHVSSSEALEELWKARFSRSSGRPRKQLPTSQPPPLEIHRQQLFDCMKLNSNFI